jgi:hypothetical protein
MDLLNDLIREQSELAAVRDCFADPMDSHPEDHKRVGHLVLVPEVHVVYLHPEKGQYIVIPDEGPLFTNCLLEGQTWCNRMPMPALSESVRPKFLRRAFHEIGHAVACFLAEIKVEYVTILPSENAAMRLDGICRYDYDLPQKKAADPVIWNKRLLLASMGGITSEIEYLKRQNRPVEAEHEFAWSCDISAIRNRLAELEPDEAEDQEKLRKCTCSILTEKFKFHWSGIELATDLIMEKGAISGEMVGECLGSVELIDLSQLN